MSDRQFTPREALDSFVEATHWWAEDILPRAATVDLDGPGLGQWTLRELIAHTTRAFKITVEYADPAPATGSDLLSASGYFRLGMKIEGVHGDVAERGRQEAAETPDVVTASLEWADKALQTVGAQLPQSTARTRMGDLRFDQFLATRTLELVVHGTDVGAAIGVDSAPPRKAAVVALTVLIECIDDADVVAVLRALSGRGSISPGFSVLG